MMTRRVRTFLELRGDICGRDTLAIAGTLLMLLIIDLKQLLNKVRKNTADGCR